MAYLSYVRLNRVQVCQENVLQADALQAGIEEDIAGRTAIGVQSLFSILPQTDSKLIEPPER